MGVMWKKFGFGSSTEGTEDAEAQRGFFLGGRTNTKIEIRIWVECRNV